MSDAPKTRTLSLVVTSGERLVERRWRVEVIDGADRGRQVVRDGGTLIIGSQREADLPLTDPTVSRHHAELALHAEGVEVRDLESKNGVFFLGKRVDRAFVPPGGTVRIGQTTIEITAEDSTLANDALRTNSFGEFVTCSPALAQTLGILQVAAVAQATILIEGETGTGKELLARAIHDTSGRTDRPFIVVDCSAIQENLLESQLFGHKRGSFTGAIADQLGAFEAAQSGTIFLDELGELPLTLQPKLLRVLETRTVTRVGETAGRNIDVRFIAATNQNLDAMVRAKRFRSDLFFRLAVVRVHIPPLRERPEDIPLLAEHYAQLFGGKRLSAATIAALAAYGWPGNARELRNVIERAAALSNKISVEPPDLFLDPRADHDSPAMEGRFREVKDRVIAEFEKRYVRELLAKHRGNVSQAASDAGLTRNALYALMRRAGIEPNE